jgi:hypothetical protein
MQPYTHHPEEPPNGGSAQERSIATLFRQLSRDLGTLLRQESELARTELRERVGQFGSGVTALGAGALIAFAGGLVLLHGAVYALAPVFDSPALAALVVGLAAVLAGVFMLMRGRKRLKAEELVPRRTVESLRQDVEIVAGNGPRTQ